MFTVQKAALLKNTARHERMIEACDKSPEDKKKNPKNKTFLKPAESSGCLMQLQQPLPYLEG